MIRPAAVLLAIALSGTAQGAYIDSINPDTDPTDFVSYGFDSVGWYYTPTQSYTLTGIFTIFPQDEFGGFARTSTVQIQTDRPVNGGTVLGQGTYFADNFTGVGHGADLTNPVALTAGVTYFVDFLNIRGLGVNLGQWTTVNGVHVPYNGATTRLDAYYRGNGSDTSFSISSSGDAADQSTGFGTVSGIEPILFFQGTPGVASVPEPSSLLMLGLGLAGAAWKLRR